MRSADSLADQSRIGEIETRTRPSSRRVRPTRSIDESSATVRICQIIASFPPITGGAEMATWRLSGELLSRSVPVVVLTRRRPGLSHFARLGRVAVVRAGHPSDSKIGALTFVLHGLWLLATRLRRYGVLHVQNLDAPLLLGMLARLLLACRLIATSHGQRRLVRNARSRRGAVRIRLMRHLVDRFTALTPEMAHQLQANGIPNSRIEVVPNGVDTREYSPRLSAEKQCIRRQLGLPEAAVITVFVGRLVSLKRVDILIRAWTTSSSTDDGLLIILGDGPERAALQQLASTIDANRIRFLGTCEVVTSYLQAADLFVLPSDHEGLSVALLEAMAAGLPVIVTDLPGNRLIVRHGHNGLLVPVGDAAALGSRLDSLLVDDELRGRLGRAARETVLEGYDLSRVAERYERLYRSVAALPR